MLIRFSVENFLSFRDEVELSMIAGKVQQHPNHVIPSEKARGTNTLKASVVYGANASGKSNLVKAMDFARKFIVNGTRLRESISVRPFRLDREYLDRPSKFEFWFSHRSKSYIYGFSLDVQSVHEEWLYEITSNSEKPIFERKTTPDGQANIEFSNKKLSAKDHQFLQFTAMGTRPNQLFLTESIQRNVKNFEDVYEWFKEFLVIIFPESRRMGLEGDVMENEEFKKSLQQFLRLFDTGISGIELRETNFDEEANIPDDLKAEAKQLLRDENLDMIIGARDGRRYLLQRDEKNEIQAMKLMTLHQVSGEIEPVAFEVNEESDGTQRLFHLVPALMELLSVDKVFVFDELDRSLHPHLSYKILELFLSNKTERRSQLIVTTHESGILDLDLLRRDEIWFVEKDNNGASTLYALEEFTPRYDADIRKGYLLGRFGAIPIIRNVHNLDWLQ